MKWCAAAVQSNGKVQCSNCGKLLFSLEGSEATRRERLQAHEPTCRAVVYRGTRLTRECSTCQRTVTCDYWINHKNHCFPSCFPSTLESSEERCNAEPSKIGAFGKFFLGEFLNLYNQPQIGFLSTLFYSLAPIYHFCPPIFHSMSLVCPRSQAELRSFEASTFGGTDWAYSRYQTVH